MKKLSRTSTAATVALATCVLMCAPHPAAAKTKGDRAGSTGEAAKLIAQLRSADASERASAACALGRMGSGARAAIPRLVELLSDGSPVEKTCGSEPPFEDEQWEPDDATIKETTVGEAATQALTAIGDGAHDALVEALAAAESWRARKNAAWALAHRGDSRAMRQMIDALRDTAWQVRAEAAYALFQRGGDGADAVNALISAAAGDEAWQVRRQAVFALGHKSGGPVGVVEPLLHILRHDREPRVREEAAGALWHSANARAFPVLVEALKDEAGGVRARVADTLGNRAGNEEVGLLIAALNDGDARVREGARRALKIVKHRSQGRVTHLRPLPDGIPE